jgi:DNA-binding CsgD family transcriptional regulator/PAS domain-containing protein
MQYMLTGPAAGETDISSLIGSIYDAAVTPELWPEVMETCRQFVGGMSATVFAKNVTGDRGGVYFYDGRLDPERSSAYFTEFAPLDPSNTLQVFADVEQAIVTSRQIDLDDFTKSRFAREWAMPMGIVDMVVAPIERRGSWAALFGVFRHERDGLGDETARQRVTMLAPHVRRAVNIGDIIGRMRTEADGFRTTIDGLAAGVFLVDAEGRQVHVNEAGKKLLGTGRALSAGHEGTLRLDRKSMRDLLPRPGRSDVGSMYVETTSGERFVAHVLPLADGARRFTGLGGDAVAALFVQPADFDPPSIPESLARAFDLTPGELRVALATIKHDGVADVADTLGISEATVRTHLHRIFAKTDTRRQADIVKLVAGFKSPLAVR